MLEYCVIGTLVLLGCLFTVMSFGGNFNGYLLGLKSDLSKHANSAQTVQVSNSGPVTAAVLGAGFQDVTVQLSDSSTVSLQNYPTDINKSLQTAGANGTTTVLAQQLQSLAEQLMAQGKLTPDQGNQLIALANKGYDMAAAEKVVEAAALASNGDKTAFHDTPVVFQGQTMTAMSAAMLVGTSQEGLQGKLSTDFNSILSQVQSSGALSDPAVQQLVGSLSGNITTIGQQFLSRTGAVNNATATGSTPESILSLQGAQTTNQDSTVICGTGDGTSNGSSCQ